MTAQEACRKELAIAVMREAEKAVAGQAPVKRNRFIKLTGETKSVNRDLEAKARGLAGWKGYTPTSPSSLRSS